MEIPKNDAANKVQQMQALVFEMLCDVDDYCNENNIIYYLSGGSCLGAVRHHGFIPWDDDGDIMIPRSSFEEFINGFAEKYRQKYGVGSLNYDSDWPMPSGRIWNLNTESHYKYLDTKSMGVFIDVYPIDGLPDSKIKQKLIYSYLKTLNVCRHASMRKGFMEGERYRNFKRILHPFCKIFGPHFFAKKMENCVIRYSFDSSKYVAVSIACHYGERETIEQINMNSGVLLPFNGRMFPVPVGYNVYLENLYGNYMEIPKDAEEKSYTHLGHWEVNINSKEN